MSEEIIQTILGNSDHLPTKYKSYYSSQQRVRKSWCFAQTTSEMNQSCDVRAMGKARPHPGLR